MKLSEVLRNFDACFYSGGHNEITARAKRDRIYVVKVESRKQRRMAIAATAAGNGHCAPRCRRK